MASDPRTTRRAARAPGLAVFDLDGTLIDSAPGILAAMADCLADHGIAPAAPLHAGLIGPPLLPTLAAISGRNDAALLAQLAESFKRRYDTDGFRLTQPYPGVDDSLRTLRARGWTLAIATNKRARPTASILAHLQWTDLFVRVSTLDTPSPPFADKTAMLADLQARCAGATGEAVMVGDTDGDAAAAEACAMAYCHVGWGYGEPARDRPVARRCDTPACLVDYLNASHFTGSPCASA